MMGRRWQKVVPHVVLVVLVAFVGTVGGRFVVEKNGVTVTAPEALKGKYVSAIANFGIPQYGGTMMGVVVYPPSAARKACIDLSTLDVSFVKTETSGGLPIVALLDRGDCFFAEKVYFAQSVGAAAVLVVDDKSEPLITMDAPEEDLTTQDIVNNISIPSALIEKSFGERMKKFLGDGERVVLNFDWTESLPHPDDRVEYEFWTNSNDECGPKCEAQMNFIKEFRGVAQILEKGQYTQFTPHYITWYCPEPFIQSKQCQVQCINHGRYCAPDPEQDFSRGYDGKDVVMENLRQLCVYQNAMDKKRPWVWWDYVTDFQIRCPMKEQKYNQACAEDVLKSLSISVDEIRDCIGDTASDKDHAVLSAEQAAQVGKGSRGDVTILPTLIINNRQYRGKLDKGAVLKALCSGFLETTDPPPCLSEDIQTNECLSNNGGCWQNVKANVTACQDTFRGRVCSCPLVNGVQLQGDGYNFCEALGRGRCNVDNGGCWQESQGTLTYSACTDTSSKGCVCPEGFKGDGVTHCDDINECKERTACQCPECICNNNWGSYDCKCSGDLLYIREHDTCISKKSSTYKVGWAITLAILAGLAVAGLIGYVVYKYRLRSYMDSEIRAIMAQYMPLDSQGDVHQHLQDP